MVLDIAYLNPPYKHTHVYTFMYIYLEFFFVFFGGVHFLHLISCLSHCLNVQKCVKEHGLKCKRKTEWSYQNPRNKLFNPCDVQPPNFSRENVHVSILGYIVSPHCTVLILFFTQYSHCQGCTLSQPICSFDRHKHPSHDHKKDVNK